MANGQAAWVHGESENVYTDDELFMVCGFRGVSLIDQHRESISLERAAENFGSTFLDPAAACPALFKRIIH